MFARVRRLLGKTDPPDPTQAKARDDALEAAAAADALADRIRRLRRSSVRAELRLARPPRRGA